MKQNETIQIDTASMMGTYGIVYEYQVIINRQMTPSISLEGLKELRRLCDCFIRFGNDVSKWSDSTTETDP